MVHANGYSHLLRVNGREGGSRSLTGFQLTKLWDTLCTLLRMRAVTTEDVSNKVRTLGGGGGFGRAVRELRRGCCGGAVCAGAYVDSTPA
jgi:hypothetical protein